MTSPQGQQFDHSVKFYLYSVILIIPVNLICHMAVLGKCFLSPWLPWSPKPHPSVRKGAQWWSAWLKTGGGGGGWASPASLRFGPWARHIYPSLVLVQPRKTRPCLTERFLMWHKESNQTNLASEQKSGSISSCANSEGGGGQGVLTPLLKITKYRVF